MNNQKLKEFNGIFVRAGQYHINTLTGHFAKLAPGIKTIRESLDYHLNSSQHSIHERFYGRFSVLQSAIITTLAEGDSEGLTLKQIADNVYAENSAPENPENAIGTAISRIKQAASVLPWQAHIIGSQNGKVFLMGAPSKDIE